jgi:HD superfamily phosphohydrolase
MWKTSTKMFEVEQKILSLRCLKRLHFIHHGGSFYLNTHYIHTRLQHTIGVYSLLSYFNPEDTNLRIAALLHDVGHAPFSHTTERIDGVDHRRWTEEIITDSEVTDILNDAKIQISLILDLIEGRQSSILSNKSGYLHLDHLDSWVRSAYASGTLKLTPNEIINKLSIVNDYVQTDEHTAQILFVSV